MPTVKLGLPTITGNQTNDVPRDLNALATAVDQKAGAAGGFALLNEAGIVVNEDGSEVGGGEAGEVLVADAGNFYISGNAEGVLQEVGQAISGVRTNMVASMNGILNS